MTHIYLIDTQQLCNYMGIANFVENQDYALAQSGTMLFLPRFHLSIGIGRGQFRGY